MSQAAWWSGFAVLLRKFHQWCWVNARGETYNTWSRREVTQHELVPVVFPIVYKDTNQHIGRVVSMPS